MFVHTEWIDDDALRYLIRSLKSRTDGADAKRVSFLISYLLAVDKAYGPLTDGPLGHAARPLRCTYTQSLGGRLYCTSVRGPKWEDGFPSFVCAQGMPHMLRPFLMGRWAHDIDIENCHVTLLYQLCAYYHLWPEHNGKVHPLKLDSLKMLYDDRAEFYEHLATVHSLPTDAEKYPGYRKDVCKLLFLRVLNGGSYTKWLSDNGMCPHQRSSRVVRLENEINNIRCAINRCKRFSDLILHEKRAQEAKNRYGEAAERGIFSKVLQHLECAVLKSIRTYLIARGWVVHSLIFDGLTVEHRPTAPLALREIERHVELDTQFCIRLVEKPLYNFTSSIDELLAS